jgi:plasmid stabilization system protein ParE
MKFRVIIQPPARRDIEAAFLYLNERAPVAAQRWLEGIEEAIASLEFMPRRCAVAPESKDFPEEIYHHFYGKRRGIYRILFVIRGDEVRVLHVRHGARDTMPRDQIKP